MAKLFIESLNKRVNDIKPGLLGLLNTIKVPSKGNLFADIELLTAYVLPKLNTLSAIELQLSELQNDYSQALNEKNSLNEELKEKIGEITNLNNQIAEVKKDIKNLRSDLITKQDIINNKEKELVSIKAEYQQLSAENQVLLRERESLIAGINSKLVEFKINNFSVDSITDIPKLLEDVINHLNKSSQNEQSTFEFISKLFRTLFDNLQMTNLYKEIENLETIEYNLDVIYNNIKDKLDLITNLFNKYDDLFVDQLLFEGKLSTLDSLIEDYKILNRFKIDLQLLLKD